MSKDRFDLEQAIMAAWSTADTTGEIAAYIMDSPDFEGMDAKHADMIGNLLMGHHEISKLKFQILWEIFEDMVHERKM